MKQAKGSGCWLQFVHCAYLLLKSRYFGHRFRVGDWGRGLGLGKRENKGSVQDTREQESEWGQVLIMQGIELDNFNISCSVATASSW